MHKCVWTEHTSDELQLVQALQCRLVSTTRTNIPQGSTTNSSACLIVACDDDVFLLYG